MTHSHKLSLIMPGAASTRPSLVTHAFKYPDASRVSHRQGEGPKKPRPCQPSKFFERRRPTRRRLGGATGVSAYVLTHCELHVINHPTSATIPIRKVCNSAHSPAGSRARKRQAWSPGYSLKSSEGRQEVQQYLLPGVSAQRHPSPARHPTTHLVNALTSYAPICIYIHSRPLQQLSWSAGARL